VEFSATFDFVGPVLQICLIDLLLSGDNAILIAMACRNLPADGAPQGGPPGHRRRRGVPRTS
jgi:predicted tellurium resistance membrane protein TerC